jgi:peptidoglycan/xylan/chitin deacetylase (PgdA/CDA1 family)
MVAILVCGSLIWNVAAAGRWSPTGATPQAADAPREEQAPPQPPGNPGAQPPVTPPAAPPPPVDPTLVSKVRGEGKIVALTLDDGPWPEWTEKVLDLLARNDVKATFCMVGQQAKDHPSLVRKVVAAGHALCNHSMTHDTSLKKRTPEAIRAQMQDTLDAIHAASPGTPVHWFRAPGGNWSDEVQNTAASLNMRSLHWTVDTTDWQKPGVAKMMDNVHRELGPRGIILCHDGGGDRTQTLAMLEQLVPQLKADGYTFVVPQP